MIHTIIKRDREGALKAIKAEKERREKLARELEITKPIAQQVVAINDELERRSVELATLRQQCKELKTNNHTFQNERDNLEKQLSEKEQELFNLRALKLSIAATTEDDKKLLAKLLAQHTDEISKNKKILAEKEAQLNAAKASHEEKEKKWKKDSEKDSDLLLGLVKTEKAQRQEAMAEQQKTMASLQQFGEWFTQKTDNLTKQLNRQHNRLEHAQRLTSAIQAKVESSKVKDAIQAQAADPSTALSLMQSQSAAPTQPSDSLNKSINMLGSFQNVPGTENAQQAIPTPGFQNYFPNDYNEAKSTVNPELIDATVSAEFDRISCIVPDMQNKKKYAFDQIALGALWFKRLIENDQEKIEQLEKHASQSDHLNAVISLPWLLYSHALKRKKGFEEGTFVIEDQNLVIYNFLMRYCKRFNPTLKGTKEDPASHATLNPYAYSRDSSHFKESQKHNTHMGIDVRYGPNSAAEPNLPAGKRHLLFGIVDDKKRDLIFIKPENNGLYIHDGLKEHSHEYIVSNIRKMPGAQTLGMVNKTDDHPDYRKERTEKQFLAVFNAAVEQCNLDNWLKEELKSMAKVEGKKTLFERRWMIKAIPEIAPLEQLAQLIERDPDFDPATAAFTTAREIAMNNNQLLSSTVKYNNKTINK